MAEQKQVKTSISEYLIQIQRMTKRNLELLKAINDSFFTKAQHLVVDVDDTQYIIPSFLSLENRLNTLQSNFENLVNAPKTGAAAFDFNGATQAIELKSFSNIPNPVLDGVTDNEFMTFDFSKNNIFKDFCTPQPFIKVDLQSLPTDITTLNVRKVVFKSDVIKASIAEVITEDNTSIGYTYADLKKLLEVYVKDVDYQEYDTQLQMPIRTGLGEGDFKIQAINDNHTDDAFDEYYNLTLDTLLYHTDDGTIQHQLAVGDRLTANDGRCRLEITDLKVSDRTVTVRVMDGAYANLVTESQDDTQCVIRYLNNTDFAAFKYINIPLEEDQYVAIFIAPIQLGNQAPWGTGILLNTYGLSTEINGTTYYYKDYYERFVNNVGDTLFDLTDLFDQGLNNYQESGFLRLTNAVPVVEGLEVLQINRHLDNSATIEEIYKLYDQKTSYSDELKTVQSQMDDINSILSSTNFQDTTQSRTSYEQQLTTLRSQKKSLTQNLLEITKEIADKASSTTTPIDNPKYRIRGMFDYVKFLSINNIEKEKVIALEVQYRYRNPSSTTGTAVTLSTPHLNEAGGEDITPIFSDWNVMTGFYNHRQASFNGAGSGFSYAWDGDTSGLNIPSFNQVDIPITQGETVDIRLRVIYNTGFPFIQVMSAWSEVVNIPFPEELKQKVTILDIIDDNNEDIRKNQFEDILEKHGINTHVDDRFEDQDVEFLHHPESIASGFYTAERRVIPLKDKLQSMDADVLALKDEVLGTSTEDLTVTLEDSVSVTDVSPWTPNLHIVPSFAGAEQTNHVAREILNLKLLNKSNHTVKIFPILPGDSDTPITERTYSGLFRIGDYMMDDGGTIIGAFIRNTSTPVKETPNSQNIYRQHMNQWMYLRVKDVYNGDMLYTKEKSRTDSGIKYDVRELNDVQYGAGDALTGQGSLVTDIPDNRTSNHIYAVLYPSINKWNDICIDPTDSRKCILLQPGEFLTLPFIFDYTFVDYLNGGAQATGSSGGDFGDDLASIEKKISFDIRTSLYKDPTNYEFTVRAYYNDKLGDRLRKKKSKSKYTPVVVATSNTKTVSK